MSFSSLWPHLRWFRRFLWSGGLLVWGWWIACPKQKLWSAGERRIRLRTTETGQKQGDIPDLEQGNRSQNPDLSGQNHLSISWFFESCLMEYSSCQYSKAICNEISVPSPSYLKPDVEKPFESNFFSLMRGTIQSRVKVIKGQMKELRLRKSKINCEDPK